MYNNNYSAASGIMGGAMVLFYLVFYVIVLAIAVLSIIANCKLFTKAGESWWKAIIPYYNFWVLMRLITERNVLWFILMFIPGAQIVAMCYMLYKVPIAFGKGPGWGVANIFLGGIMTIILGFSSNTEYVGY